MGFIKDTEREEIIKRINKSYAFRKFWISLVIAALIGFIILVFLILAGKMGPAFEGEKLTGLGWGMLIYGVLVLAFGVVSLILTFTIRSPKKIADDVTKLVTTPISGKKLESYGSAAKIAIDRKTSKAVKSVIADQANPVPPTFKPTEGKVVRQPGKPLGPKGF